MSERSSEPIAMRYAPEGLLGSGGAADVYRVRDRATGALLALKRLRKASSEHMRSDFALLFEREFHTLAQLKHAGIVQVHDYGVEGGEPYYTMELLDGSDMRELAPLPWRQACLSLCEVASALALLHSRRLVHRDLSPRNVRRTAAGRTKLLDFGAMMAMGVARRLVGTPGYVAPEQVGGQELDARSDLFGLGALAYWMLTGRHAYKARRFRNLAAAWRVRPPPPSAIAPDIPADLDALVLSLMSLEPAGRPASAAEVIARLRALTDQPGDETSEDAHAYLTTPTLVGRSEALISLRQQVLRATRGQGTSVVIEGAPGMGRSRLLGALVLEAKLAGALVLDADAADGSGEEYGILRALVDRLLEIAPARARQSAKPYALQLNVAFPALGLRPPSRPPSGSTTASLLDALVGWFCDLSQEHPLCISVDDLPSADAASIAFVVRLSSQARTRRLVVAVSAESGASPPLQRALDQLESNGLRIALSPLDAAQNEALLRSVFGDVPNLPTIATWIHEISGGRPASCLQLAQHLVDRGVARLVNGAFSLPYELDRLSLPASHEQAFEQRTAALQPCARALLELLALSTRFAPLGAADHLALLGGAFRHSQVFAALDELVRERMIVQSEGHYALRDATLARVVDRSLTAQRRREVHAALAKHLEHRAGVVGAVANYHLLHAGAFRRSFDSQIERRSKVSSIASPDVVFDRSELGAAFLEQLYAAAKEHRLSPRELFPLQKQLVQLATVANAEHGRHIDDVLPRLLEDSGLVYFDEQADLPPLERIGACLQRAQARHDATPEAERGLAPIEAVRELAVMVGVMMGLYARTMDAERAAQLPGLLRPLSPLSPLIDIVTHLTTNSVEALLYAADVHEDRDRLLDVLSRPIAGLDEVSRLGAVQLLSFYQALDSASRGSAKALEIATQLEKIEDYAPLACQVRVIYYTVHGDIAAAQLAREQREALALLHVDANTHLIRSSFYEASVAYYAGDIVGCRKLLDIMAQEAARHPGWRPWHAYASALVDTLRGDSAAALQSIERVFACSSEVGHAARVMATMHQVELLARGPEPERAVRVGRELIARREAERRPLSRSLMLDLGLALAEARTGDHASGAARLERAIALQERSGDAAVPLVLLAAQRARIALLAGDDRAFAEYAERAARRAQGLRHPGLIARLHQLASEASNAQQPIGPELAHGADPTTSVTIASRASAGDQVLARLASESDHELRARLGLQLLLTDAHSAGGCLFAAAAGGPLLRAALNVTVDAALTDAVRALLARAQSDDTEKTQIETNAVPRGSTQSVNVLSHRGERLQAFLLHGSQGASGLLLLVAPDSSLLRVHAELLCAVSDAVCDQGRGN